MPLSRTNLWRAVGVSAVLTTLACTACGSAATDRANGSAPASSTVGTTVSGSTDIAAVAPAGTTEPSSTAPSATPTPTTRPLRSFTIAASGDILLHTTVQAQGYADGGGKTFDFGPMFSEVKKQISAADLAICHQETPLSADDSDVMGYPMFNAPHEIAPALAASGFDGCDTASNHSLDRGYAGVKSTLDAFDAAGLKHSGSARSAEEGASPPIYDAKGVKVGHLAYTYGTNGIPVPRSQPWLLNIINKDKMLADAHALKAAGADVVVMSIHWGTEYQTQPTAEQVDLAHALLASPDVDLILGDHVHVVQPMEKIGDKYVIYGMGNFLSNQSPDSDPSLSASTQDGALFEWTFQEKPLGGFAAVKATYTPTFVRHPDYVIDPVSTKNNPQSYARTVAAINSLGPGTNDATPA